jgi:Mg-chelatase subunit ChlD
MEYWINIGTTSKYDGEGVKRFGRPACKFVIVLDISGSMGSPFKSTNEKEQTTIIETAKRVMRDMLQVIKPSDYYSLVIFDNVSEVI